MIEGLVISVRVIPPRNHRNGFQLFAVRTCSWTVMHRPRFGEFPYLAVKITNPAVSLSSFLTVSPSSFPGFGDILIYCTCIGCVEFIIKPTSKIIIDCDYMYLLSRRCGSTGTIPVVIPPLPIPSSALGAHTTLPAS